METFKCSVCGKEKEIKKDGGTGYGVNDKDEKVCYECCGVQDTEYMKNNNRIDLYWDGKEITNWPGSLRIKPRSTKDGKHNMAGKRYDTWFTFAGKEWHGVTYGDNTQIHHCKAYKD